MSYNEVLVSIALIGLWVFYILSKSGYKGTKYLKNIAGRKPNLVFGNLLDFIGGSSKLLRALMEYTDTYGGVFKIHDGPLSVAVVISEPKFMEFMLTSTAMITKADQYDYLKNWLGTGLLTSTGSKWKKRRRMLTPSFHFSILEQFVDVFESVGTIFIRKLEQEVGKSSVNIYPLVTMCTLDIICEAAMGVPINAQDNGNSEYVRCVKTMCAIVIDRTFSPLHRSLYPLTINYFKEKRALKVLHAHTDSVIDQKIKEQASNTYDKEKDELGIKRRVAFLDLLLQSTIDGKPLSRTDLREEVDTFMFEGHDTTSSAISFILYSLATNPEVQRKAVDEQRQIFENIKDPKATASTLQQMKYLELVIKETLRLYPSVPFFGRIVGEDFERDGIIYPKGLNIMLFPFATQRNSKYFSEPEKFIPERFDVNEDKTLFSYVPFSAGARNCIGQKFAMLEMKSTVSKVLRNFELYPSKPAHVLELAPETILVSKNGVCISLKKRNKL